MVWSVADRDAEVGRRLDSPLHRVGEARGRLFGRLAPAPARVMGLDDALGAVAAADVASPVGVPAYEVALADGYALAAVDIAGAGPTSPVALMTPPRLVCVGARLPSGADCVVPAGMIATGVIPEAFGSAAPGEGVRHAGEDLATAALIVRAGERIDPLRLHALRACGLTSVAVRRPSVRLLAVGRASGDLGTAQLIADLAREEGCDGRMESAPRERERLAQALRGPSTDALFLVGGSGEGEGDDSVAALRALGAVIDHGFALQPGGTTAIGQLDGTPVIVFPGRPEAALAAWLAFGAALARTLCGAGEAPTAPARPLNRKIASSVGLTQIAPLVLEDSNWRPLAVGDVTLSHMARADAFLVVPEDSEGQPEGAVVAPVLAPGRWRG